MISYHDAARIAEETLLLQVRKLYGLDVYTVTRIEAHEGGRNLVYRAEGNDTKIIRISYLPDRSREDYQAETAYVRYLCDHGASVANVIASENGKLVEVLDASQCQFFVCVFETAKGDSLSDHHYYYRDGAPLSEYFYNCGKTLGQMHRLSKTYVPAYRRYDFFDKYNEAFLGGLIPEEYPLLKQKLKDLLKKLGSLEKSPQHYGMVHFDYSDGNYRIDYETGKITVFDFDNCCTCWYMFDLANLWTHGVGWIQFEPDREKRKAFMDDYFSTVLAGYRSETDMDDGMLALLPLFVQTVLMENIADTFEVMRFTGEASQSDEALLYCIKCMEEDIPFMGFFHEIYDCNEPFEWSRE